MDSQKSKVQGKLRKGVFFPAAGALVIFIGLVAAFPDKAYEVLTGLLYKMGGSCGNMGCIPDYVPLVLRTVCILFRTCYRFRSASL